VSLEDRLIVRTPIVRIPGIPNPNNLLGSNKYERFAEWISSRESLFRFGLDCTGWIFPTVIGAATRNRFSLYEALFQSGLEVFGMGFATSITKLANIISGFFHLKPDENQNLRNYMLFGLKDLDSDESIEKAAARLQNEEIQDLGFTKDLSQDNDKNNAWFTQRADDIKDFFSKFKVDTDQRHRLKNFKKGVILIDSTLEGILWGGYFLFNRLFRKYVLRQDRFTGTKAYANDDESKKVGDSTPYNWLQKSGIGLSMMIAPLMNYGALKLIDNEEAVKNNKWLQMIKDQWDVTHGIYPKLGLLWSYMFVPVTMGALFSAQGKSEFIEQILTQFVMGNSWFFGHRLTNGVLAKAADSRLAKKHNVAPGILVEHDYLHQPTPEPAKIQHVLKQTQSNPTLERDARKAHANVLYSGFALHSALVLAVRLMINMFTKWRVKREIAK
jgi:hypothetical protein